jgi:hypothetical protein
MHTVDDRLLQSTSENAQVMRRLKVHARSQGSETKPQAQAQPLNRRRHTKTRKSIAFIGGGKPFVVVPGPRTPRG